MSSYLQIPTIHEFNNFWYNHNNHVVNLPDASREHLWKVHNTPKHTSQYRQELRHQWSLRSQEHLEGLQHGHPSYPREQQHRNQHELAWQLAFGAVRWWCHWGSCRPWRLHHDPKVINEMMRLMIIWRLPCSNKDPKQCPCIRWHQGTWIWSWLEHEEQYHWGCKLLQLGIYKDEEIFT